MSWLIICTILILGMGGPALNPTISTDGQPRGKPKPKVSRTNTKETNSACTGEYQPMPMDTYQCEFGVVDLICGNCVPGKLTNHPKLEYPWVARAAGIKGVARVKFVINGKGRVLWARVTNEVHPLLKSAAIKEVCSRTYDPFVCNRRTVKVINYINYKFGVP